MVAFSRLHRAGKPAIPSVVKPMQPPRLRIGKLVADPAVEVVFEAVPDAVEIVEPPRPRD